MKSLRTTDIVVAALIAVATSLAGEAALAQSGAAKVWPTRVVCIILPGSPGAGSDIIGRVLAQPLSKNTIRPRTRAGAGRAQAPATKQGRADA